MEGDDDDEDPDKRGVAGKSGAGSGTSVVRANLRIDPNSLNAKRWAKCKLQSKFDP